MHNHSHVIEFSIGVSFVLGVLHALEPGHGKSAMFVYMLQQRKSFWHPIVMGVTTGLSHAASLMVIALVIGVFSAGIASSSILCGFLFQFVGSFFRSINRNRISANTLATIQAMAIIAIGSFYISQLIAG